MTPTTWPLEHDAEVGAAVDHRGLQQHRRVRGHEDLAPGEALGAGASRAPGPAGPATRSPEQLLEAGRVAQRPREAGRAGRGPVEPLGEVGAQHPVRARRRPGW